MTKLQIQQLLEKAYSSHFLNSIELLVEKESEYKKSDFFKQTKIQLFTLYEKFFVYQESKYSLSNKIDEFINDIDTEKLELLVVDLLERINKNSRIGELMAQLLKNFNLDALLADSTKLQTMLADLKK